MIYKLENAETIFQVDGAVGKKIACINDCEYLLIKIKPNNIIQSHSLDIPVTFYIQKGNGELKLDDKIFQIAAGDLIEIKPHVKREWKNSGKQKLELLVIKHMKGT